MTADSLKVALCDRFLKYYNNDSLSDFSIICGSKKWKVHKFVLCVHSDVLAIICSGRFQEAKKKGFLDLSEQTAEEVQTLIYYLYHFDWDSSDPEGTWLGDMSFCIDMAIFADKYFIPGLTRVASDKFRVDMWSLLEDWDGSLRSDVGMLASKAYAVPHATKEIREQLVDCVVEEGTAGDAALLQAMRTQGEFATDIALALEKQTPSEDEDTKD